MIVRAIVFESTDFSHRKDYIRVEKPRDDTRDDDHDVVFSILPRNMDELKNILGHVSDPSSSMYGKYLSTADIALISANPLGTRRVKAFLQNNNITIVHETLHGEYLVGRARISIWEDILRTKFYTFEQIETGVKVHRAYEYTVDESISEFINTLFNVTHLPLHNQNTVQLNKQKVFQSFDSSRKSALATGSASGYITPSLLNSYYDIFTNDGHNLATQSIFSSSNQYFSPANIASFQQAYNIPAHPVDADPNHRSSSFQCISNPSKCQESNLDLEYILALAQNTYTSLVYVCVGVGDPPVTYSWWATL